MIHNGDQVQRDDDSDWHEGEECNQCDDCKWTVSRTFDDRNECEKGEDEECEGDDDEDGVQDEEWEEDCCEGNSSVVDVHVALLGFLEGRESEFGNAVGMYCC